MGTVICKVTGKISNAVSVMGMDTHRACRLVDAAVKMRPYWEKTSQF
jgi:hypothetical protein